MFFGFDFVKGYLDIWLWIFSIILDIIILDYKGDGGY